MAAEEERKMFSLKVLVDKEQNRVVFAESDKDFVDVLLSFLTLPIGTIVRLVRRQSQTAEIACLTALYEGLENLNVRHLRCKDMLLCPRNSSEAHCRMLKLNVDDTGPTKYYTCHRIPQCKQDSRSFVSTFRNDKCICGDLMFREVILIDNNVDKAANGDGGVFVMGEAMFMITDDLQVMPMSTAISFALLNKLGIRDMNALEEKTVNVGLDEVLWLLRLSLLSETPLTDVFLLKGGDTSGAVKLEPEVAVHSPSGEDTVSNSEKMTLKVTVRKSNNKALYAEAEEDFINFLFSLLAFPLGAVVKLLDGTPSLGCIPNLYKSVEGLNTDRYIKSVDHKALLLSPKIAPQLGYKNQPLGVEALRPYFLGSGSKPVHPPLGTTSELGFVKGPALFMVTDDLVVTPLSPISAISLLNKLQVPIYDVEEREVRVGPDEAMRLLKASMISKSALTNAFNFNISLKKPKQEE